MEELNKKYPDTEAILQELNQRSQNDTRPKLRECQLESLRKEKCYPDNKEFQSSCKNDIIQRNHAVCPNKNIKDFFFYGTKVKSQDDFQKCCNSSSFENELYYLFFLLFVLIFILFFLAIYKYRRIIKQRCLEYFKKERKKGIKEKYKPPQQENQPPHQENQNQMLHFMFPLNKEPMDSKRLESVSDTAKRDICELNSNEYRNQIYSPSFPPMTIKLN